MLATIFAWTICSILLFGQAESSPDSSKVRERYDKFLMPDGSNLYVHSWLGNSIQDHSCSQVLTEPKKLIVLPMNLADLIGSLIPHAGEAQGDLPPDLANLLDLLGTLVPRSRDFPPAYLMEGVNPPKRGVISTEKTGNMPPRNPAGGMTPSSEKVPPAMRNFFNKLNKLFRKIGLSVRARKRRDTGEIIAKNHLDVQIN